MLVIINLSRANVGFFPLVRNLRDTRLPPGRVFFVIGLDGLCGGSADVKKSAPPHLLCDAEGLMLPSALLDGVGANL